MLVCCIKIRLLYIPVLLTRFLHDSLHEAIVSGQVCAGWRFPALKGLLTTVSGKISSPPLRNF
jgi:hypothetical protein